MELSKLPLVGIGGMKPEPPLLKPVEIPPAIVKPFAPDDCATLSWPPAPAVVFRLNILWETVKGAVPEETDAVMFDCIGLGGMNPPPCVEFQVATFPEKTAEAEPCEAVS